MLTDKQRHALLMADRTRDVEIITAAVIKTIEENEFITLWDVERAFRDGAAQSYVIHDEPFSIVLGMPAMLAAVAAMEITPEQNHIRLGATRAIRK